MQYRLLGRTKLQVSVVGMGTSPLRMVSEKQAIETLRSAIDQGINIIHTAPDYEGAEHLIARALRESSPAHPVHVCCQGWGTRDYFERTFEKSLAVNVQILMQDIPAQLPASAITTSRIFVRNLGDKIWRSQRTGPEGPVILRVRLNGTINQIVRLRQDVPPGAQIHFVFDLKAPTKRGRYRVGLELANKVRWPFVSRPFFVAASMLEVV